MIEPPQPRDPWKDNQFGTPEDLHAAGAVIAAWSLCEQTLEQLLYRTLKIDHRLNSRLFHALGNQSRIDLQLIEGKERLSKEQYASVQDFVRHFSICKENRNLIAHASYGHNDITGDLSLHKVSSKDKITQNIFSVSNAGMWEIANAIHQLSQWGFWLSVAIWTGPDGVIQAGDQLLIVPLPETPPSPRKLTPFAPPAP